jgi:hypothetical protein
MLTRDVSGPTCMELALYPSLPSHMRTPPAKLLIFSRTMPSVKGLMDSAYHVTRWHSTKK